MNKLITSLRTRFTTIKSLFAFLIEYKMWWMIPMIALLLLLFLVIILGHSTPLGPLIYTIF